MWRLRIGVSARIQYGDAAKPGYLKKNLYYHAGPLLREFLDATRLQCCG